MFRLVGSASSVGPTTSATRPYFWLVCDNRHCGVSARAEQPEVQMGENVNDIIYAAMQAMLTRAKAEGWLYAIDGHFCPTHHKAMVEIEKAKMEQFAAQAPQGAQGAQQQRTQQPSQPPQPLVQLSTNDAEVRRLQKVAEMNRKREEEFRNPAQLRKAN